MRIPRLALLSVCLPLVLGCRSQAKDLTAEYALMARFVATIPVETELDVGWQATHEAWLELIDGAERSIDLAHFYASDRGLDGAADPAAPTRLGPLVTALEAAAERGVRVRFLADARFDRTYPALLTRLEAHPGIALRRYDLEQLTDGVQHAKYMLVDGYKACLGSANFDWRSLEHILELGMSIEQREVGLAIGDVFELDWHLAGGGEGDRAPAPRATADDFPAAAVLLPSRDDSGPWIIQVTPVFSPGGLLPDESLWDLPHLIERIDNASERVWIQLLTWRMVDRDGTRFWELESAVQRAAERGVDVRLLVADWGKRKGTIEHLQELAAREDIAVRMITIPEHSSGHIPFGRVIHAKYMVVDSDKAWLGSSNWERNYFHASRNVGLLLDGQAATDQLADFFEHGWASPYAYDVEPETEYEVPAFGERN